MTQFASANFNGLNTDLISVDSNWAQLDSGSGIADIYSNRVMSRISTNPAHYYHSATPPSADYEVSCDLYVVGTTSTTLNGGPMARCVVGELTGYWTRWRNGTGIQLFRYNTATATQLGSTVAYSPTTGTTFRLRLKVQGSVISVYKDAETTPIITVTDSSPITAAGKTGILIANVSSTDGPHIDNFSADTLSGASTHDASGSLSASAATIAGSAAHVATHSASGGMVAESALLTGSATRSGSFITHAASGGLTSGSATIAGSAASFTVHSASGGMVAAVATIAGTAVRSSPGVASFSTPPLKNNTGAVYASVSGWTVNVFNPTTGALVVQKTGLTTDASGVLTVSDAALVAAATYSYEPVHATYGRRLPTAAAA